MTITAPTRRTPPLARAAVLMTAVALAVVGVLGARPIDSLATLTDTERTEDATVSSGSVSLALASAAGRGTWTGSISLVPGQSFYSAITVTNDGTSRLRYSVTSGSSSALAEVLVLDIVTTNESSSCDDTSFLSRPVIAGPTTFGASPPAALIGSQAVGDQDGDRELAPGASDHLCARVAFPFGTGLGAAGRGSIATTVFTFVAENS